MILSRFIFDDQGTFGRLGPWFTGELPWRNNASLISCIPAGKYRVVWAPSPRLHKNTYRILGVPNREGILVHSCNFLGDRSLGYRCQLLGCIALGERLGVMEGQRAILVSRPAVRAFEDLMKRQPFELEIRDA